MSFYVVIPARLASTRLPNKPLADIAGKPMIVRVAEQARLSGASDVIVATDHESIVDVCSGFGIRVDEERSCFRNRSYCGNIPENGLVAIGDGS